MKKVVLLLLITSVLPLSYGQPSPCRGENLDIVENVKKIDFNKADFTFVELQLKNDSNNYRWKDVLEGDSIVTNKLILAPSSYKYCSNIKYKSNRNGRFYSTSNTANDILIIQSGMQKMYIVFPHSDRIENEYFFGAIVDLLNKLNTPKGKRAYYNPNRYISNIEFKKGIFFIKDYDKKFGVKAFDKNDIIEFFPDNNVYDHRNPKGYWGDKVSFISMFDEKKGLEYSKIFPGNYTEDQAIEIIVRNHPRILNEILKSIADDIKQKRSRTTREKELLDIWYALSIGNVRTEEVELLNELNSKKRPIEEIYNKYKEFKKSEFFSILIFDYELALKYYKYFIDDKSDLKPFKVFIEQHNFKFNKEQLKVFIENIEN